MPSQVGITALVIASLLGITFEVMIATLLVITEPEGVPVGLPFSDPLPAN